MRRQKNPESTPAAAPARYPVRMKRAGAPARLRRWTFRGLIGACALCVLLNWLIGGSPWCLYVLVSAFVFYTVFVSKALVDASLLHKLLCGMVSTGALLLLIQWLGIGHWATHTVVPLVLFGGVCVGAALFSLNIADQRLYVSPYMALLALGISYPLAIVITTGRMTWPNITLLSTAGAALAVSCLRFHGLIRHEYQKKLSTR